MSKLSESNFTPLSAQQTISLLVTFLLDLIQVSTFLKDKCRIKGEYEALQLTRTPHYGLY